MGVIGRHFDCSIGADVDVSAGEGLHGADAARRLQANPTSFEVQRVSETLGLHSHELDEALVREWLFEPIEELGCGVHLVVVLAESSVPECTSGSVCFKVAWQSGKEWLRQIPQVAPVPSG